MKDDLLLIDALYRQTFRKRERYPELRVKLEQARRFVLSPEMTAFLAELVFESFQGRIIKYRLPKASKRICKLLDDIRFFSRLPHKITWVEYSEADKWRQLQRIEARVGVPMWGVHFNDMDMDAVIRKHESYNMRLGWLLQQHDKVDTSFSCTMFGGNVSHVTNLSDFDCIWDTENDVVAWPIDPASETPEKMVSTPEWHRLGVGECRTAFPKYANTLLEDDEHFNDLRYVWTFLSTINKIPMAGAQKVESSRGFVAMGSYRKFLDHTTITLNVPQKNIKKLTLRVLGDIIRRRAHQVRGHWRDDWHQPKGNKAIWIAEHQRGDASLGFVTHDYNVDHEA